MHCGGRCKNKTSAKGESNLLLSLAWAAANFQELRAWPLVAKNDFLWSAGVRGGARPLPRRLLWVQMNYSSVCPRRRWRGQGLVCQIFRFLSGAFRSVPGMVNDAEEVSCNSCSLSRNSRSKGCPMELKINKIKPDTGLSFFISVIKF